MSAFRNSILSRPERALALLLALYAAVSAWDFGKRHACIDYYQFWVVGRAVGAGEGRDIYSDAERQRLGQLSWQRAIADARAKTPVGSTSPTPTKRLQAASQRQTLETYSTPWLYALFGLFSSSGYDSSQRDFQLASLLAYLAAIFLLARLLRLPAVAVFLWIAALLQWFNPFVDDTIAGNVNRLQLLALAAFLWLGSSGGLGSRGRFRGRHVAAGALLGATLAFKPNLGAAALVFLLGGAIAGERKRVLATLAGILAGAVAAVAASAAYFGSFDVWTTWLRQLPVLMASGSAAAGSAGEGNYSLVRLLHDRAGLPGGQWLTVLLLSAVTVALFIERRRRTALRSADDSEPARDLLLLGAGAALSLLSSELSWQHYFVVLVPLAMALLRPAPDGAPPRALIAAAALLGLAMVSLQNVGRLLDFHDPSTAAAVVSGGALLLFVAALADLARPRLLASPAASA